MARRRARLRAASHRSVFMSAIRLSKRRGLALAIPVVLIGLAAAAQPPSRDANVAQAQAATGGPCNGKPAKLYRNPMGAPDTSPVPKKDSMNMDYIPVCEDEAGQPAGTVQISLDKVQRLGGRSQAVEERELARTVRAFASVQSDRGKPPGVGPKAGRGA